ncbi:MAG: hypothetical protein WBA10_10045 [Elainellaceae cyanobacterium]
MSPVTAYAKAPSSQQSDQTTDLLSQTFPLCYMEIPGVGIRDLAELCTETEASSESAQQPSAADDQSSEATQRLRQNVYPSGQAFSLCYMEMSSGEIRNLNSLCAESSVEGSQKPTVEEEPCYFLDVDGRPCQ